MDKDATKAVIQTLRAYLNDELPLDKDFIRELDYRNLLARNKAAMLVAMADRGDNDCIHQLITYMEQFYTEETLLKLCAFLKEYAKQARPRLATLASRIGQEILKHKPKVTLHRSAGVHDDEEVLFPVITALKHMFSELVSKVFVVINKLKEERMEELHSYLTTLLTPSGGQGLPRHVRHARFPIVPKPVDGFKEFLQFRWDELNIQVLESIVKHLKDDKLTEMMSHYQQTLSKEETTSLGECSTKSVQIVVTPEETLVPITIDQNPDQQTLGDVFSLCNFFHTLRIVPAIFRGFKRGCTVLFFSIPTECVWSLPSCLLPSNLSLLEELKVLFFSVKGAFTVDIKERRVIASLDNELSGVQATFLKPFVPAMADSSSNDAKSEVTNKAKSRTEGGDGGSSGRVLPNTGSSTSSGLRHRIQTTRLNTEYDEDDDHGYQQPQPSQQREQRGACSISARYGSSCSWAVGLLLLAVALMLVGGGVCTLNGLYCAAAECTDCVAGGLRYCPSLYLQFLCSLRYGVRNQETPVTGSECPGTTQYQQSEENMTNILVLAAFGMLIHTTNKSMASSDFNKVKKFGPGATAGAIYTAPGNGRAGVNLVDSSTGDILLHMDHRFEWGTNPYTGTFWEDIMVLNSKIDGNWGGEQHVKPVYYTPGSLVAVGARAGKDSFTIVINGQQLATYRYRGEVSSIDKIEFYKENCGGCELIMKQLVVMPVYG